MTTPPESVPPDRPVGRSEPPAYGGDSELHAFVDGQLPRDRFATVVRALAADPARLEQVADWAAQRRALKSLHAGLDPGAVPHGLTGAVVRPAAGRWSGRWAVAASAMVALVIGALAGVMGGEAWRGNDDTATSGSGALHLARGTPGFVREAAVAHVVYTPEKRHPVEVAGADEAHLVQWLSRRLGQPLRAPDLQPEGWRLLGGRLLPGDPSPRAQFMYQDAAGRRVTLFVTVFAAADAPAETSFRSVRHGTRESFYWIDGRFGYALSAELPSDQLQALARSVYQQLAD